jgi:hypothetical protein
MTTVATRVAGLPGGHQAIQPKKGTVARGELFIKLALLVPSSRIAVRRKRP